MDYYALKTRYALLGRDFLTWLYHRCAVHQGLLPEAPQTEIFIDDQVVMHGEGDRPSTTSFRGEAIGRRELREALRAGKKIVRAKLHIARDAGDFSLTLDTDDWTIRGLQLPISSGSNSDLEHHVLDRLALLEEAEEVLERLFKRYLKARTSNVYNGWVVELVSWVGAPPFSPAPPPPSPAP